MKTIYRDRTDYTQQEAHAIALRLCYDYGLRAASRETTTGWSVQIDGTDRIVYPDSRTETADAIRQAELAGV